MLSVKDEFTEKDECLLNELGFKAEGITYFKKYGDNGFQVILNPAMPGGYSKVVIGYLNEEIEDIEEGCIDEVTDISPIYEDMTFLYCVGILIKEIGGSK